MNVKSILSEGIRLAARNKKFLVLFWATNAVMAFVLSIPIYSLLIDNLNHSLYSDRLAAQFDYFWYVQFINIYHGTISHLPLATYSVVILYGLIQNFFFGGLVAVFNQPKKNHISDFFYGGVRYWYRFMKILLISIIFFFIAFIIQDMVRNFALVVFPGIRSDLVNFSFRFLQYLFLIFLIGIITIISDYSRIFMAVENKPRAIYALKKTSVFIFNNFKVVFTVFLFVAIIGAFGAVLYNIIDNYVPREPYYFLALSFILQQMLIILRLFVRMIFASTEVFIYKDESADFVKADVKESKIRVN